MTSLASYLPYIQIVLSLLLIGGVLLQQSEASVGSAFGGGDSFSAVKHSRRGIEKILFNSTIVIGVLFAVTAFLSLIFK